MTGGPPLDNRALQPACAILPGDQRVLELPLEILQTVCAGKLFPDAHPQGQLRMVPDEFVLLAVRLG